jgi:hypothetical protein
MRVGIGRSFICEKELLAQLVTELDGSTLRDGEVDRVVWKFESSGKFTIIRHVISYLKVVLSLGK